MEWKTLSTGETGENHDYMKCSACGAPFMESESNDLLYFPDLELKHTWKEIDRLKEQHNIDLSADAAVVCESCVHRINELLD